MGESRSASWVPSRGAVVAGHTWRLQSIMEFHVRPQPPRHRARARLPQALPQVGYPARATRLARRGAARRRTVRRLTGHSRTVRRLASRRRGRRRPVAGAAGDDPPETARRRRRLGDRPPVTAHRRRRRRPPAASTAGDCPPQVPLEVQACPPEVGLPAAGAAKDSPPQARAALPKTARRRRIILRGCRCSGGDGRRD
jgi:hypothetical protein